MVGLKVKLKEDIKTRALKNNTVYEVISVEKDWYRIMSDYDEDYLFPPEMFDIVEEQ